MKILTLICMVAAALGVVGAGQEAPVGPKPPNLLLIVADDLGFSDLGCYGGEIATPNLDALAAGGLRFTQFYNTARCWPSRAALLTGYYAQQVRRDAVPGVPSGTAGVRPAWARLLSERLRPAGYRSYHSGKWHVDGQPLRNGFDHSYSLNDHDRYFAPQLHTEDDLALPPVSTNSGYYATTAIADHAIKCLQEHGVRHPTKPFFEFLAFTAPHFPMQAPAADIARYATRYVNGWDRLREERWERMRALGVTASALSAVERGVGPPYAFPEAVARLGANEINRPLPWRGLTEAQRGFQAAKMAVHAAMVDRMDREIGRVLAQLRSMGAFENTLILFLSDNGASAEMMVRGDGHNPEAECGTGATFLSIGPGWSSLANTPFRRHKTWVHEGGISTPLIAHWPAGIAARGELRHTPAHLIDVVPTILDLVAGPVWQPDASPSLPPRPGKSLVPVFAKDGAVSRDSLWWLHEGNRALRAGDWKIVAAGTNAAWELYDLNRDRAETHDLATERPEKVRELAELWTRQTAAHLALALQAAPGPYAAWKHSGGLFVITTPDGADLPAAAALENFPLLIRLRRDFFDFQQAKTGGEDLRFSTPAGEPLAYQIEDWDPVAGTASVWVRVPQIRGQARQELRLHWGNAAALSESNGKAVFNAANGYLGVWHMSGPVKDVVGGVEAKDAGTTATGGVVGPARHFAGGQGIFGGDQITGYPTGSSPHTTEAWLRPEKVNGTVVAWGNEQAQGKVVMQFRSPPHVNVDCYFSDGNVRSRRPLATSEWIQVVHTYAPGDARVYVNGVLDGMANSRARPLSLASPARLWLGGWYDNYDFVGDLDEVRISRVVRSADWVKLQFENQKPLQTVVGHLVQSGSAFSVTPERLTVLEGQGGLFKAEAGGAQKVYWVLKDGNTETVVATDRFQYRFEAGRVTGGKAVVLQFKAIYPTETRVKEIPIAIAENLPDPVFKLNAPRAWDGRTPVDVALELTNADALAAGTVRELKVVWSVSDIATSQEVLPGRLHLTRAQKSGALRVTATADNGGQSVTQTIMIQVTEPERDPWVVRIPGPDEKPVSNQFVARDDQGDGALHYRGALPGKADAVFVRVTADGQPYRNEVSRLSPGNNYAFSVKLRPGLVRYQVEFGSTTGGVETVLDTVTNVVCGDAYLINGQSNAVATDWGPGEPDFRSDWIRTYGGMSSDPESPRGWGNAVHRGRDGEQLQIGYWGMELARRLVENQRIPICILNGAVGGTRIDQHQRPAADPADPGTIYGRLLRRAREARLTHGLRGVLWHQGENDQGADGPTGGFGWETYRQLFIDLAGAWQQDYPNIRRQYVFQIWPKSCEMGIAGSDNRLREVQRTLPRAFSRMSIMSTLGVEPPGGCHFPADGYAEFARLIYPLVARDHYGQVFELSVTPPDLKRAFFATDRRDAVVLEFDQPVRWIPALVDQFQLDGDAAAVVSGLGAGRTVTLVLKAPSTARTISYLDGKSWSQAKLLRGENGIAALTFWGVPLESRKP